jgi:hypothetical protein
MGFFFRKHKEKDAGWDPDKEYPVLKCSICNGEQVLGLKDKATGEFRELACIKGNDELAEWKRTLGVSDIPKEY